MKTKIIATLILVTFLYLFLDSRLDLLKRQHIRGMIKNIKYTKVINQEILTGKIETRKDCLNEKKIKQVFGNVCYSLKSKFTIDGELFDLDKNINNLWHPKFKLINNKLYVMYFTGAEQVINLKVFTKKKSDVLLSSSYKIKHISNYKKNYTINSFDFGVNGDFVVISIHSSNTILYAVWNPNKVGEAITFKTMFNETSWLEEEPVIVTNGKSLFLLFLSGRYIGGGSPGSLTHVSKYIKVTKSFERPRVFNWSRLKTYEMHPINMIRIDRNENIIFNPVDSGNFYKVNYQNLPTIKTTYELLRDTFI